MAKADLFVEVEGIVRVVVLLRPQVLLDVHVHPSPGGRGGASSWEPTDIALDIRAPPSQVWRAQVRYRVRT